VYLGFGKCRCARFMELAPRIFSSVFRILIMWMHRFVEPALGIFSSVFRIFENVGALVCGTGHQKILGLLKMWAHRFVGPATGKYCGCTGLWNRPPEYFLVYLIF
jgi:hypothetical protein